MVGTAYLDVEQKPELLVPWRRHVFEEILEARHRLVRALTGSKRADLGPVAVDDFLLQFEAAV